MDEFIKYIKDNPTIIVSAYAAIISTIALIWNIINSILDRLDRIKVSVRFNRTILGCENEKIEEGPDLMVISVVNKSARVKYIKAPSLKLSYHHGNKLSEKEDDTIVTLYNIKKRINYPLEIKPESEITLEYPFQANSNWIFNNSHESSKFKVVITDTVNKKYNSKRIKLSILKKCIEHNSKIDESVMSYYNQYIQ
ncbi:hypothetical protein PMW00_13360 [Clostridium paraputrificum]|uniref:hypothetical protein n=1 Tax=Clostridium paraputrificum TaxID=29363 RepID=UPI0012B93B38|nr:hypothetical protein [Clostridium paraputrificum]MDB2104004.1 hypothetical protein [Clostridium paraputrificum]